MSFVVCAGMAGYPPEQRPQFHTEKRKASMFTSLIQSVHKGISDFFTRILRHFQTEKIWGAVVFAAASLLCESLCFCGRDLRIGF